MFSWKRAVEPLSPASQGAFAHRQFTTHAGDGAFACLQAGASAPQRGEPHQAWVMLVRGSAA
jgi:hypothetical protein